MIRKTIGKMIGKIVKVGVMKKGALKMEPFDKKG